MQGSEKVIAALNMTLQEEFTALCQYFIHAEMCPRPWLVVSAGCSPAAIWCNSPPAAGCESPVGAEPFFCLRFPDVLVVILLPLIDLLAVNVSLARSRLIIPSFCHRSVRCRPPRRRGYGVRRRPDDSAAHRAYRASLGHCRY